MDNSPDARTLLLYRIATYLTHLSPFCEYVANFRRRWAIPEGGFSLADCMAREHLAYDVYSFWVTWMLDDQRGADVSESSTEEFESPRTLDLFAELKMEERRLSRLIRPFNYLARSEFIRIADPTWPSKNSFTVRGSPLTSKADSLKPAVSRALRSSAFFFPLPAPSFVDTRLIDEWLSKHQNFDWLTPFRPSNELLERKSLKHTDDVSAAVNYWSASVPILQQLSRTEASNLILDLLYQPEVVLAKLAQGSRTLDHLLNPTPRLRALSQTWTVLYPDALIDGDGKVSITFEPGTSGRTLRKLIPKVIEATKRQKGSRIYKARRGKDTDKPEGGSRLLELIQARAKADSGEKRKDLVNHLLEVFEMPDFEEEIILVRLSQLKKEGFRYKPVKVSESA